MRWRILRRCAGSSPNMSTSTRSRCSGGPEPRLEARRRLAQGISVKMKDFVSLANPVLAKTRNVVVKTLLKTPRVGDYIREARFKPPPTYPNGDYFGLPRSRRNGAEGRPIPQPQVRTYDGRRALLDDVLGEEFALVGCAADPRAGLDAKTLAGLEALGARFVALYPFGGRPQADEVPKDGSVSAFGSRRPHRR